MCALRPGLEAEPSVIVEVRFRDGLKCPHEVYLSGLFNRQFFGGEVESLGILLLGEVNMFQGLPPIMRLPNCQGSMVHIAMRFLASRLHSGWIDRVIIEFHLPDDPLELGAVDGGPAILLQCLAEFGVIVGVDVGLLRDSQQIGIPGLSGDGIEGGELWGGCGLVDLDAEGFVDPFALGFLEGLDPFAALVLLACLR